MTISTLETFYDNGFVVLKNVLDSERCEVLRAEIESDLEPLVGPLEFEADVGYPGAPTHRLAPGGQTPRRLLHAYTRSQSWRDLALADRLTDYLTDALNCSQVLLSQCHHNCIMTKFPGHSSATLWHQDIRYWSFDRPELISAWFALGHEHAANGALQVIPGSHKLELDRGRLDRALFLRTDLGANQALIQQAEAVELHAGDVLLFHCRLFHAAGPNQTESVKLSPVFTYHCADNLPIPETRSARLPSICMPSSDLPDPHLPNGGAKN